MIRIGITGQNGFVGSHLYMTLGLHPDEFQRIPFEKFFFESDDLLDEFVSNCDVIIHLAGMNRHEDPQVIFDTNVNLAKQLVLSLERTACTPQIIMSSSTQEETDNLYGKSKKEAREILEQWAKKNNALFNGLVIPNVFGPFGKPFYNSVVATFCYQITKGESPTIHLDGQLKLIYVGELVSQILDKIRNQETTTRNLVPHTAEYKVSEILVFLNDYKASYQDKGEIPLLNNSFEFHLFNTYRGYMDIASHFPVKLTQHTDDRGSFVEIIRLGIGGQVSFSTTVPGITRGNHFHTRKIERFAVIKGKALIQLRKIGTDETLDFYLDGNEPAYVDMPIWYTHNIKNIGEEVLYTNFWINEAYNPDDSDTYFENV